jgi:hypothetical protein
MTHRIISTAAITVVLLAGSVPAEEPLKSGPQVGARNNRGGFYPNFVAGPFAGENRCPV